MHPWAMRRAPDSGYGRCDGSEGDSALADGSMPLLVRGALRPSAPMPRVEHRGPAPRVPAGPVGLEPPLQVRCYGTRGSLSPLIRTFRAYSPRSGPGDPQPCARAVPWVEGRNQQHADDQPFTLGLGDFLHTLDLIAAKEVDRHRLGVGSWGVAPTNGPNLSRSTPGLP